jgi:hypothetical protein
MMRCPDCRERLPGHPERYGARCPACRAPLYEEEPSRRRGSSDDRCAIHPENPALGTCARCGNYQCAVCRTHWRGRWLCAACVDRTLDRKETIPAEAVAHLRQALLALGLGILSWLIFVVAMVLVVAGLGSQNLLVAGLGGLTMFASPLPSIFGVGQGIAALRARGDHMILATLGLILSGLNVGAFIGLFSFSIGMQM